MDGVWLGFVIVIYHCFTACNVAAEWCSTLYRNCYTGCCDYDCCSQYTTTHRWPDWTTTLTTINSTTSTESSLAAGIGIGISFVVFLVIIVSAGVCFYMYRRSRRPPPAFSQSMTVPMTTLQQGNQMLFQTPVGVNNSVGFIPPGGAVQHTPYTVTTPQQQNSYPANSLASPAYSNPSSNNNFNVLPQNQPVTSQRDTTQNAPPPYTDPIIVSSVNALAQNQPMTLQQTPYLNTNIVQDAPPPYTGSEIKPSAPHEHDL